MGDDDFMPELTTENIVACVARVRSERRGVAAFDPTSGALIVSPDLDLKIRRSLEREVRRLKFGLFLQCDLCRFEVFFAKVRCALLRVRGYLVGYSGQFAFEGHGTSPCLPVG
jgi:hypothetical protein